MHEVAATRQLRPPSPNYESRSIGNNLGDLEQEIASVRQSNPPPPSSGDGITANVRRSVLEEREIASARISHPLEQRNESDETLELSPILH
jgi:hypothetical protein